MGGCHGQYRRTMRASFRLRVDPSLNRVRLTDSRAGIYSKVGIKRVNPVDIVCLFGNERGPKRRDGKAICAWRR